MYTIVNWDYPVIREMFITDFSHFSVMMFENSRAERNQNENHLSLQRQSNRAVLRLVTKHRDHVKDIVILHQVYKCFHQDRLELKPVKVISRVFRWNHFHISRSVELESSRFAEFYHFLCLFGHSSVFVSNIAGYYSLTSDGGNKSV